MKHILLSLFVITQLGCSEDKLPKYVELNSLRVLALVVDTPEVAPGATVTLTPAVSDINGSGGLMFTAEACVDPGVYFGVEPACTATMTGYQSLGVNVPLTTPTVANNYTGAANSFTVTVPSSSTIFANKNTRDQYNGVAYLVTYTLDSGDGRRVKSFRRISVVNTALRPTLNSNPTVADILSNGTSLTTYPAGQTVTLSAQISSTPEIYSVMNTEGGLKSITETHQTTWFISDGSLKYYRTLSTDGNEYAAVATAPSTRKAFIISVTRDGRGGMAVVTKAFP